MKKKLPRVNRNKPAKPGKLQLFDLPALFTQIEHLYRSDYFSRDVKHGTIYPLYVALAREPFGTPDHLTLIKPFRAMHINHSLTRRELEKVVQKEFAQDVLDRINQLHAKYTKP